MIFQKRSNSDASQIKIQRSAAFTLYHVSSLSPHRLDVSLFSRNTMKQIYFVQYDIKGLLVIMWPEIIIEVHFSRGIRSVADFNFNLSSTSITIDFLAFTCIHGFLLVTWKQRREVVAVTLTYQLCKTSTMIIVW